MRWIFYTALPNSSYLVLISGRLALKLNVDNHCCCNQFFWNWNCWGCQLKGVSRYWRNHQIILSLPYTPEFCHQVSTTPSFSINKHTHWLRRSYAEILKKRTDLGFGERGYSTSGNSTALKKTYPERDFKGKDKMSAKIVSGTEVSKWVRFFLYIRHWISWNF